MLLLEKEVAASGADPGMVFAPGDPQVFIYQEF